MKRVLLLMSFTLVFWSCEKDDDIVPITDPQVVTEFLTQLSQTNLFVGDLSELEVNSNAFEYDLVTPLFTDYAHKLRVIALPEGESMVYSGSGFPSFPNGTMIAKTFYYNNNEQDLSQGKTIIETRVLIRKNNTWTIGNYVWNEDQTDAVLDENEHTLPVSWKNEQGVDMSTNYVVPSKTDCIKCHSNSGMTTIIGPKLRSMNFNVNGINQLQDFIDHGYLTGAPDVATIDALPDWEDTSYTLEERGRAYFDVNCAHCHTAGGFCEIESTLRLEYEMPFAETKILERQNQIIGRMQNYNPGISMPFIGTTMLHTEGFNLIKEYIDSLD